MQADGSLHIGAGLMQGGKERAARASRGPVAPDRLHKANVSGGAPYGVRLPDGTAEGLFVGEVAMPFVAYLNLVFRHGGFPASVPGDQQWMIKRALTAGLLAL